MTRSLRYALLLAALLCFGWTGILAAPAPRITLLPSSGPRTIGKGTIVTFHTRVTGITLDGRHMGGSPHKRFGHLQVYVDAIPADAWSRKDLMHHWLASVAAPTFTLKLSAAILGGGRRHHIIIALAGNNDVLLHAPTATMAVTVKG